MRKQLFGLGVVALAAVLTTSAFAQGRGVTFTPVGLFEDDFPLTTVVSISDDGKTAVGMHAFFQGNYIWNEETGRGDLGPVNGAPRISGDASVVSSTPFEPVAFAFSQSAIWTGGFWPDQTWEFIPTPPDFSFCDSSGQSVHNMNSDGKFVTGLTWLDPGGANGNGCGGASGFLWEEGVGTTVLDNSVNNDSTRGNAVNADGSVVVGWGQTNTREAMKWVNGVQSFICPNPSGQGGDIFCTEGWDVSADGSLILTSAATPLDFNARAAIINEDQDIEFIPFPAVPGDPQFDTLSLYAMSDDGSTAVGSFGGGGFFGSPPYPVLWNRDLGMTIDLQVMLLGQGLDDLFFWFLTDALAVSADGKKIGGSGTNPDGWVEGFVVDLSKVKVCHKPESPIWTVENGRTVTIDWEDLKAHLDHGDILSTCEFAGVGGGLSRAMEMRENSIRRGLPMSDVRTSSRAATSFQRGVQDPTADSRLRSAEEWNGILGAIGAGGFNVQTYPEQTVKPVAETGSPINRRGRTNKSERRR